MKCGGVAHNEPEPADSGQIGAVLWVAVPHGCNETPKQSKEGDDGTALSLALAVEGERGNA